MLTPVAAAVLTDLRRLGISMEDDPARKQLYGKDYSHHAPRTPQLVAFPTDEVQVQHIVRVCSTHCFPVISHGKGTSLEGHIIPVQGGLCLSFARMRKLLAVHKGDLQIVCEPGLSFMALNKQLRQHGLYFPLDAGPGATIGGMCSTSASGTKAVRYGTMKENVLSLRVVLANGAAVKTASRARKTSAGLNLTSLFVGSEGILGVITQCTVRVYPIPALSRAALVSFPTMHLAAEAVMAMMQRELALTMVELLCDQMMRALNLKFKFTYAELPTLYVEFSGDSESAVEAQTVTVKEIVAQFQASNFVFARNEEERQELWKARKAALFASHALRPGKELTVWTTDVCVPVSRLAACVCETQADIQRLGLVAPLVGHCGDGNFHLFILMDRNDPDEVRRAHELNARMVQRAIDMEGTCTGEHGVGIGKAAYLEAELGAEAVTLMHTLKLAVDPKGIMNPGKVLLVSKSSL